MSPQLATLVLMDHGFKYIGFNPYGWCNLALHEKGNVRCQVYIPTHDDSQFEAHCRQLTKINVEKAIAEAKVQEVLELCP
jgi:hypothetical protein